MYSFVRDSRERRVEKKGVVFCLHWGLPLKIFCKVEISKYTSQFEVIPKLWKQEFKYVSVQIKMPQVILTNIVNVLWSFWKLFIFVHFFALPNRRRAKLRKCGSLENGKSVQLAKKHEIHVKFNSLYNLLYNFQTLVW